MISRLILSVIIKISPLVYQNTGKHIHINDFEYKPSKYGSIHTSPLVISSDLVHVVASPTQLHTVTNRCFLSDDCTL